MLQIRDNPLISTLFQLKGNPRASVYTEPMWSIPYHLFIPYTSVYMLALGLTDAQIGGIASLSLLIQPFFALLSGAITDKYGRRLTTFVSDLLAWSLPTLIWAFAQDIRFFIAAAVFNAMWQIPANAWTCLLVEDAEDSQLVHIWTWIYIGGLLSGFFAPLAGLLIGAIDLVPAVRWLYIFAFIMMTIKGWILFRYSTETQQGQRSMAAAQGQSIFKLLNGYGDVFKRVLRTPRTVIVLGIMFVMSVVMIVNGNFWSILLTEKLNFPPEDLATFTFIKSIFLLTFYFVLVPRLDLTRFRNPMIWGFTGFFIAALILVMMPPGNYGLVTLSILIEAVSLVMFRPLMDSLVIVSIDAHERARINSILSIIVIGLSSPFGWIAGQLSEANRNYPFLMIMGLFIAGMVLVSLAWRKRLPDPENS